MSDTPGICPHCGYDLVLASPVEDGDYLFVPGDGVYFRRRRINAAPQCHEILGTLMRERGHPVSRIVLAERIGYDGDHPENIIAVQLCNLRRALPGVTVPFATVPKVGVRWLPQ